MPRTPTNRKGWKRKADRLLSEYIKQRDNNTCQKCGKKHAQMHPHHLISRGVSVLRHDPKNLVLLCPACHFFAHHRSIEFTKWLEEKHSDILTGYLIQQAKKPYKVDYQEVCSKLENLIKEAG